ncbi:MAG: hypothetical protein A3K19_14780 [Lentisphaerae bacterium RIFOXYB12_FULL_65_16]|nr:MAG: hypothetical protein A3K18_14385 [Lentisphaerae bacterium RIFOXYA12_64_32]OGV87840.1 MAG: hypothetical protein A3K19_14780 [Lentisphaerae bacterium RIFOXYB12_FULL_65_16]
MKLFGFYALSSAWLFSLLLPLILFYFLKLRRPRHDVPSLFLWRKVLEDRRVNSPFQKFKRNLLLLLQILLLLLIVIAAMQPYFRSRQARVHRLPVLIDNSASMAALDRPDGVSRLDVAREKVQTLIDGLLPDQELCLVTFARSAHKRTGFTNDRRLLREALDQVTVEDVPSDIEEALRLVQSLARSTPFDEVLLFSDGNLPPRVDIEMSFNLNYQRLPPAGANLGITSLNAQRAPERRWDVFVRVEGSSETATGAQLELRQGETVVASERVSVSRQDSQRVVFRVQGDQPSDIEVRLTPDSVDSMESDNAVWLHLPAARPIRAQVPGHLASYRHALAAIPDVELAAESAAAGEPCDLVIRDEPPGTGPTARTSLYIGCVPEELKPLVRVEPKPIEVVDWERNSPLLQHVQFRDVIVLEDPQSAPGTQTSQFENLGYAILAHGPHGPLILRRETPDGLTFVCLFHTDRSTLPYRIGFPILVANLVQVAMRHAGVAEVEAGRTGVLARTTVTAGAACTITGPGGVSATATADTHGNLAGVAAPRAGCYTVAVSGGGKVPVGASLLSAAETGLASVEQIEFSENLTVRAESASVKTEKPLWAALSLLAFVVMLGEWWYYQRRAG